MDRARKKPPSLWSQSWGPCDGPIPACLKEGDELQRKQFEFQSLSEYINGSRLPARWCSISLIQDIKIIHCKRDLISNTEMSTKLNFSLPNIVTVSFRVQNRIVDYFLCRNTNHISIKIFVFKYIIKLGCLSWFFLCQIFFCYQYHFDRQFESYAIIWEWLLASLFLA